MSDFITLFKNKMKHNGLEPPESLIPGKFHRVPGVDKGPKNRAGWCIITEDSKSGAFGDWSSGLRGYLDARTHVINTSGAKTHYDKLIREAKDRAEIARIHRQRSAAKRALSLMLAAGLAEHDHPYLLKKEIARNNAHDYKGSLMLPITSIDGRITSLQFIAPDGKKTLLRDGRKKGCFIKVAGDMVHNTDVTICEGWATGCTLAEYYPDDLTIAAIDAGNLEAVALNVRNRWPDSKIIIAGDDDRLSPKNPGRAYATAAAKAADALVSFPQWPENAPQHLSDFNDLDIWLKRGDE